jgi:ABC-2 type transport system permease protein
VNGGGVIVAVLYAAATHLAFATLSSAQVEQNGSLVDSHALAGATLLGLAMFATLFLGAVLAVFLTFNVVRGDAEAGVLQPVVVRPIGRAAFLAARYGAACSVCSAYVAAVYAAAVVITGLEGGWWPDNAVLPGVALAGGVCIVAAISLLGSVHPSTIPNGIAVLMVYGAGLVSGLLGQIGYALPSKRLEDIGRDASYALPFDALYQAGLHALTADTSGFTGVIVHLGPLGGAQGAGIGLVAWALVYVAAVLAAAAAGFARRDL